MVHYSMEPGTRKHVKEYRFLSFTRNFSKKYIKRLLDTGLDSLKTASKKVFHETGKFLGNKISDVVTNLHHNEIVETKPHEEEILKELRQLF